jgi:hypothetical protein
MVDDAMLLLTRSLGLCLLWASSRLRRRLLNWRTPRHMVSGLACTQVRTQGSGPYMALILSSQAMPISVCAWQLRSKPAQCGSTNTTYVHILRRDIALDCLRVRLCRFSPTTYRSAVRSRVVLAASLAATLWTSTRLSKRCTGTSARSSIGHCEGSRADVVGSKAQV